MLGQDKTWEIEVLLMDRPARKLCQKMILEMEEEVYSFKQTSKSLKNTLPIYNIYIHMQVQGKFHHNSRTYKTESTQSSYR